MEFCDRIALKKGEGRVKITDEGFLAGSVPVTRAGIFTYVFDGRVTRVLRHPDEVFDRASLDTLKLLPVTLEHPEEFVTPENATKYQRGSTGSKVQVVGDLVLADLAVFDRKAIDAISGGVDEISCGYRADLEDSPGLYEGERYDMMQTNIRYNHVAAVRKGRAGPRVRIPQVAYDSAFGECPMKTIQIGDKAYEVDAAVALHVDELRTQLDACGAKGRMKDADIATRDGKIAGLESEVKSLRAIVDAAQGLVSPDVVAAEVDARLKLVMDARPLLGEDALQRLVAMDSLEGKIEVLKAFSPERAGLIESYRSKGDAEFRAFVDGMYAAAREGLADAGRSQREARGAKPAAPATKVSDSPSDIVTRIYSARHEEFYKSLRVKGGA